MLRSKSNWKFTNAEELEAPILEDPSFSPIVRKLLLQRGITTEKAAKQFLSPDLNDLHDPSKLSMIDKAKERIYQAIENNEKILVFGDYDADGITSTTVLLKALDELGATCDFYIPNRFTEGYGPNEAAFQAAYDQGFSLIITVDCGIASVKEAEWAKRHQIDLIITDHHEPQKELPDAYAIIHPKCSPDYPFQELAGVGVAFKLAEYLLGYFPEHLLEFTAIGTIADLVPLVDENRILAFHGLRALTNTKTIGLKALKQVSGIEGNVTEDDVGFSIGPRLNSVGRLQDARLAVQMLLSENREEAIAIANEIDALNEERKQIVKEIVSEAELEIDSDEKEGVIIVAKEGWNEGVLGIVASRLVQKYGRPAIVLTLKPEEGLAKGSARSIPAFDLFQNCMEVKDCFTHFGGHSQAAGMTLPMDHIEFLRKHLSNRIKEQLSENDYKQEIEIAGELTVSDIDEDLIASINKLAPFGMSNPKPIFLMKEVPREAKQIGSERNHLKLQFQTEHNRLEAIGFGFGYLEPLLTPSTPVMIVGELGINEWNGIRKPQIVVQDAAIEEWQLFDARGKKSQDLAQYMDVYDKHVVLSKEAFMSHPKVMYITYDETPEKLEPMDALYIYELPEDLHQLKRFIQLAQPKNIHVCYHVEESAYLASFPKREEFVWLYSVIRKQKTLDLNKHLGTIQKLRGWSEERVKFISQVFFELGFVRIENGMITINPNPAKRDLKDSRTYQQRLQQIEVEKTLYYSNYDQLKNWFQQCMDEVETAKEGVTNGL